MYLNGIVIHKIDITSVRMYQKQIFPKFKLLASYDNIHITVFIESTVLVWSTISKTSLYHNHPHQFYNKSFPYVKQGFALAGPLGLMSPGFELLVMCNATFLRSFPLYFISIGIKLCIQSKNQKQANMFTVYKNQTQSCSQSQSKPDPG